MRYDVKMLKYYLALILILFCFAGCKKKSVDVNKPKTPPAVIVDIIIAERQAITDVIEANGTVVANEFQELRPEISGRLTYLNISEGNSVAAGTVLAKIYDADLQAQLAKTRVQLNLAQKTVERFKKLLDISGINESDYDVAVNQVNSF
ncbi:MAG: biotin/lipoyl-binding protein [Ferruginibacter sp.]|nr:biotin/lipoyl-binding protein [Ferruginibacter sp.]